MINVERKLILKFTSAWKNYQQVKTLKQMPFRRVVQLMTCTYGCNSVFIHCCYVVPQFFALTITANCNIWYAVGIRICAKKPMDYALTMIERSTHWYNLFQWYRLCNKNRLYWILISEPKSTSFWANSTSKSYQYWLQNQTKNQSYYHLHLPVELLCTTQTLKPFWVFLKSIFWFHFDDNWYSALSHTCMLTWKGMGSKISNCNGK